ncbi:hypothetical protein [Oceanobacillus saliphilus]|uniref:hypothetical protein n=1 Tax=Oceanobacillus saliphilus TaxID=2925834 RepID=UPI00201E4D93|nr:hypothetical protein [Oceanobacillus saliphilus]
MSSEAVCGREVFLCLVCGQETICALNIDEFSRLIDVHLTESQSIIVDVPPGGSMHVKGTLEVLDKSLRHNSFPEEFFDRSLEVVE